MAKVLKELAAIIGSYEDRNTGQQKNRYKNVGVLMESEHNGELNRYLLLDRSFNPAGAQAKPGSDKIIISMFDPKERDGASGSDGQHANSGPSGHQAPARNIDDEIDF